MLVGGVHWTLGAIAGCLLRPDMLHTTRRVTLRPHNTRTHNFLLRFDASAMLARACRVLLRSGVAYELPGGELLQGNATPLQRVICWHLSGLLAVLCSSCNCFEGAFILT